MHIRRLYQLDGAREAVGTAVVIDVFRAFTCEPLMYHFGAERIMLIHDIAECRRYAGKALLAGEIDGCPIEGFDLPNSPWDIMAAGCEKIAGRDIVHRTTSGVAGALAAMEHAGEVLLASFVNARATADYIRGRNPREASIVAMGVVGSFRTPEDEFCGDYIESMLAGTPYDHTEALRAIIADESAQKFLRGDRDCYPREDAVICLQRDMFDTVLRAERRGDHIESVRIGGAGRAG